MLCVLFHNIIRFPNKAIFFPHNFQHLQRLLAKETEMGALNIMYIISTVSMKFLNCLFPDHFYCRCGSHLTSEHLKLLRRYEYSS